MRKKITLLLTFLLAGLFITNGQDFVTVSGYVTNDSTGTPVAGYEVNIQADSLYNSITLTNEAGFYVDTILPNAVLGFVQVSTVDECTGIILDTLFYDVAPGTSLNADFEICVNPGGEECSANFTYQPDSTDPYMVSFFDQSTPAEAIDSWQWDFGDGNSSSEQNPVHTYNAAGIYIVCLTIHSTIDSCTDTSCTEVWVQMIGDCQADFSYTTDSTNAHIVHFFDQSVPAENIDSWQWDFGDGTGSSEQNPTHVFGDAGVYDVCLTVHSTIDSCTDTYCENVIISEPGACQADFTYQVDSNNFYQVSFFDQSMPAEGVYWWFWQFGDGTSSNDQNPVHSYNAAGTYNVCLNIKARVGDDTCSSVYCSEVEVQGGSQSYYLGGNTFAGIYQLDEGFAYAYKLENGNYTEVYSQLLDTLGYYIFYPLMEADFYTKVEPTPNSDYYGDFLPTYYGDATHWEDAQTVSLNQNIYNADINLVQITQQSQGDGLIKGKIVHQDLYKNETPAHDIQIMLANEAGEYVGLKYSDEEGNFEFSGLANGTYTLFAEIMGKSMEPKDFTLSEESHNLDDILMIIGETAVVFGIQENSSEYIKGLGEIYPNPVNSTIHLDIEMKKASALEVKIFNPSGQCVGSRNIEPGLSETIEIDTEKLRPGIYILELITKDHCKISKRFVKY
ncbi:MAG: PKD domain-containing protein [Bacteroidales bacterium]|nr:PKD domain-containing protein [Bacteroidales bacterium]MCF8350579.1 PKD domain-containing protein [Bacteroidales bacterium]MCF8377253.1 PKD domain-containing protein [Bacteroidales bacterium]MCF8401999.1 PKD domain-containing protein [Bacteroidales bacterium]